jgi:flagellar biosynthesis chaperone FliJ
MAKRVCFDPIVEGSKEWEDELLTEIENALKRLDLMEKKLHAKNIRFRNLLNKESGDIEELNRLHEEMNDGHCNWMLEQSRLNELLSLLDNKKPTW